jgi:hypothetical protein
MPSANTIVSGYQIKPSIWGILSGVLDFAYISVKFTHKGSLFPVIFYEKPLASPKVDGDIPKSRPAYR